MPEMTDTPPEIADMVRTRLMARSGAERFVMGVQMFEAARRMVLASLPTDLSELERKRALYERIYGEPLPDEMIG
jgi:hypothetical protein